MNEKQTNLSKQLSELSNKPPVANKGQIQINNFQKMNAQKQLLVHQSNYIKQQKVNHQLAKQNNSVLLSDRKHVESDFKIGNGLNILSQQRFQVQDFEG
jgi:hypothetical protein